MDGRVVVIADAEKAGAFEVVGERIAVLVDRKRTSGHEVVLHVGEEGAGPPPHRHAWDEDFYILDGEIEFAYEGCAVRLGPGGFIHIPAGVPHAFRHVTAGARALGISSPSRAVEFFAAMDALKSDPSGVQEMVATAASHGVEVVGPPRT